MFVTKIPRRSLLFISLTIMTLANLSAGLVLLRPRPAALHLTNTTAIVEADLGLSDPGPVLLPEPSTMDHLIR